MTEHLQCLNIKCGKNPAITLVQSTPTSHLSNLYKCPYCRTILDTPDEPYKWWCFIQSLCRAFTSSQQKWINDHEHNKVTLDFHEAIFEAMNDPSHNTITRLVAEIINLTESPEYRDILLNLPRYTIQND